jgi:hypothetical protein
LAIVKGGEARATIILGLGVSNKKNGREREKIAANFMLDDY